MATEQETLLDIYEKLFAEFGPQNWWPAQTPFEVAVGAILTQQTTWRNVERAISNLKEAALLEPASLAKASLQKIERCVYPAGF